MRNRGRQSRVPPPFAAEPQSLDAAFIADGVAINSGPYKRTFHRGVQAAHRRGPGGRGPGPQRGKLQAPRLALQPAAFLGRAVPDLARAGRRRAADRPDWALRPEDLPLDLPAEMAFDAKHDEPTPPLDKAPPEWLFVTLDGKRTSRETNTMPQWAGSCWYYLRFLDPTNDKALVDAEVERAWMPVDLYVGGAEHAVLHLLYARFWHKVLFDRGR